MPVDSRLGIIGKQQSIYSDHFQWRDGATGKISYGLEAPSLHLGLASALFGSLAGVCSLIDILNLELHRTALGSAYVIGSYPIGEDPKNAVADNLDRHNQLRNLPIYDS